MGARMLRAHPDACMTARGLSLSRREPGAGATRRRASRRSTVTFFGPGPALYDRCSLDQAAMAALWGRASRDAGRCPPRCGRKPRRGRHTLLGLSGSPLEKTPLMSKARRCINDLRSSSQYLYANCSELHNVDENAVTSWPRHTKGCRVAGQNAGMPADCTSLIRYRLTCNLWRAPNEIRSIESA
jgi:hypothetical protein